jgi:hypothetical protein
MKKKTYSKTKYKNLQNSRTILKHTSTCNMGFWASGTLFGNNKIQKIFLVPHSVTFSKIYIYSDSYCRSDKVRKK